MEMTKTDITTGVRTNVESMDHNYQVVRKYFTEKGFLHELDTSSNVEILWRINISMYLLGAAKRFLLDIVRDNESQLFSGISLELQNALKI
jgi:hypothetical protein